jgi:hypothetical protein
VNHTLQWRKIASVTYGGKPHFWFAYSYYGGMSVAWDRLKRQWGASYGGQFERRYFAAARAGKEYLQKRVNAAAKGVVL